MKHYLSLGAGVQSSTLRFMDEDDDPLLRLYFPPCDASIIADTVQEPAEVYRWIEYLQSCTKKSPIHVVSAGDLAAESLILRTSKKTGQVYQRTLIPAYIALPNGTKAILGRKCTAEFKVREIIKMVRKLIGKPALLAWRKKHKADLQQWNDWVKLQKLCRATKTKAPPAPFECWHRMQTDALVCQWIGISVDEADRMKSSREPWIIVKHPLIDLGMTRKDCEDWMERTGRPKPPKSACKFCPFHSDEMWLDQQTRTPEEFQESVEFERELNLGAEQCTGTARLQGRIYLHDSLRPLDQIDFASLVRKNPSRPGHTQLSLFRNECEGMCGV